jgi:hypothetical protein
LSLSLSCLPGERPSRSTSSSSFRWFSMRSEAPWPCKAHSPSASVNVLLKLMYLMQRSRNRVQLLSQLPAADKEQKIDIVIIGEVPVLNHDRKNVRYNLYSSLPYLTITIIIRNSKSALFRL